MQFGLAVGDLSCPNLRTPAKDNALPEKELFGLLIRPFNTAPFTSEEGQH